jgi:hypothetical protein
MDITGGSVRGAEFGVSGGSGEFLVLTSLHYLPYFGLVEARLGLRARNNSFSDPSAVNAVQ